MGVRERGDQFRRLVRSSLDDLFDQHRPVGRLSLAHVLMTAGDTVFAVSLAGSLFFSISPTAAKDKVLLYLLLTMGPFAVVAPALGPVIDRSRGARRAMVVASAAGRAVLCPFLARDIHSLLLFPEAFAMLVLSKVYLVTKGALVPEMAALGMLDDSGSPVGEGAQGPPVPPGPPGPAPGRRARAPAHTPPYGTPAAATDADVGPAADAAASTPDLATLNARLGLLASLSGFVFALPAVLALKIGGPATVLWLAIGVFVAGAVAGARLPVARRHGREVPAGDRSGRSRRHLREVPVTAAPSIGVRGEIVHVPHPTDPFAPDPDWIGDEDDLAAYRPIADTEVNLALMPMSVLKALVGFVTFLMAFALRRADAATWWFGFILGALTAGALIGVLLVGTLRRVFDEQQLLVGSLWLVGTVTLLGAFFPVRLLQAVVVAGIGLAGAVAKPSFDALVQRHVRESSQGKAFARFETRFQLMWVAGSFVPVVLSLPIAAGNFVMATTAVVGALSYMSSRRAVRGGRRNGAGPRSSP